MAVDPSGKLPKKNWRRIAGITALVIVGLMILFVGACFIAFAQLSQST